MFWIVKNSYLDNELEKSRSFFLLLKIISKFIKNLSLPQKQTKNDYPLRLSLIHNTRLLIN